MDCKVDPGLRENESLIVPLQFLNRLIQNSMKEIHYLNKSDTQFKNEKAFAGNPSATRF